MTRKKMRWFAAAFMVVAGLLMGHPPQTYAHILKNDGTISVVMHLPPDDEPVAGARQPIEFAYTDTTSRFDIAACNCTARISQNDKVLFEQSVSEVDALDGTVPYTFPSAGVYQLHTEGAPKSPGLFDAFAVDYTVRIDPAKTPVSANTGQLPSWFWVAIGAVMLATLGGAYALRKKRR